MLDFLKRFFTWWNGQTFGTQFYTARNGERVGEDALGNVYYRTRGGRIDPAIGVERRWVIYKGVSEASEVPPGWHGWLHHRTDVPPTEDRYEARAWELPHLPNMTGTGAAYRPIGSILRQDPRPRTGGDYSAWRPE